MALKVLNLLFFIILVFLVHSSINHAKTDKVTSPFAFLNRIKGCQKGDKTKEIFQLKHYLQKFGYLDTNRIQADADDEFDDVLESAIKTYQQNYNIKPTGILDAETVLKMTAPRCGVPDIIKGTNFMKTREQNSSSFSDSIHIVSNYSFFPGSPRWPRYKTHLTYAFFRNTPNAAIGAVARAFQAWASATQFTFSQTQNQPDLVIGFVRLDHGDGYPFDGPGGTLAHAFAPTDGRFHYDADENWSVGPVQGYFDLTTVAIHEIGHLLGLEHSRVQQAIMYPTIPPGATKNLNADDIQGIRALYG